MATNDNPRPLSAIVGENLRRFRESRGLRQEDVADEARKYGFTWGRSSVASLEAGNRDLSIGELLLLPSIVKKLGGWSEPLIPTNVPVQINEALWMPAQQIPSHVLSLMAPTELPKTLPASPATEKVEDETLLLGGVEDLDEGSFGTQISVARNVQVFEVVWRKLWPEQHDAHWRGLTSGMEVARRIAERLTTPDGGPVQFQLVQAVSMGLYGRPPGEERDARADARGTYESKRALQSARGHVTRELIDEMQAEINSRWPEIHDVLAELHKATESEEALAKWQAQLTQLRHPDWPTDPGEDDGEGATPSARGAHRKRRFLRSR